MRLWPKRRTRGRWLVSVRRLGRMLPLSVPTAKNIIIARCRGKVADGPFRGMRYLDRALGSALPPKILGTYERELHGWIEEIVCTAYTSIHVVGAAEGYYAVGFALRMPGVQVFAYDLNPASALLVRRLAARNGVAGRVECRGSFPPREYPAGIEHRQLVVCDIEGDEAELLSPERVPSLLCSDILVEVHDGRTGRIEQLLRQRFASSHRIRRLEAVPRNVVDVKVKLPPTLLLRTIRRAIDEGRQTGLTWLFMTVAPSGR